MQNFDLVRDFDLVLFIIIGIITLIAAIFVLEAKNLTHAILMLATTFMGIGAIYLLLTAEFIAMIQMTVYAGGVIVLFLFAIMLTRSEEFMVRGNLNPKTNAFFVLFLILTFGLLLVPISSTFAGSIDPQNQITNFPHGIAWVGFSIFNLYQIGILILGLIIIGALLGTIYLVKYEPEESEESEEQSGSESNAEDTNT